MTRLRTLATLAVLTFAPSARASNPAAAQALFEEARALLARGDYAAACVKFEGSLNLEPAAGTEYNLALCYEKSGRTASAWATYLSAAVAYKATQRPEWENKARERANALAPTLTKLTVVVPPNAPARVHVTRDGMLVDGSELGAAIPIDPGVHVVEASAPGMSTWRESVDLSPGASKVVTVDLTRRDTSNGESSTPTESSAADGNGSAQRSWAFVVGGVGAAGLALGAVSGVIAIGQNGTSTEQCPNDGPCANADAIRANAAARDWATVSTVGFIVGGALCAAGVTLLLTAPSRGSTRPSARRPVDVNVGMGLGGAHLRGAW